MAISLREQRLAPLAAAWLPFGVMGIPPRIEAELLEEEELGCPAARSHRRARSWGGFCPQHLAVPSAPEEAFAVPDGVVRKLGSVADCGASGWSARASPPLSPRPLSCREDPGEDETRSPDVASSVSTGSGSDSEAEASFSWTSSSKSTCSVESGAEERLVEEAGLPAPAGQAAPGMHGLGGVSCSALRCAAGQAAPGMAPEEVPQKPGEAITTLMVQNLSRTLTRRGLLDLLDGCGFAEKYDYIHLPMTFGTAKNMGFAFINFVCPEAAQEFARRFPQSDGEQIRDKMWRVAPADVQGFQANAMTALSRKMRRVRNNSFRPLLVAPQLASAGVPLSAQRRSTKQRKRAATYP